VIGEIRSFQGLNGLPTPVMAGLPTLLQQYKDLRVNQVRTHDAMGPSEIDSKFVLGNGELAWLIPDNAQRAGVVQAGNAAIIFPDWSADPEKPASYNFAPTDKVIAAIRASGAEVYYRIGRSWGANVNPPYDFEKFSSVVKHTALHYNRGWADGFHDGIRYWEFWNEPDGLFWSGTPQQFYSLYEKTARALKSVDPTLKVGGDGKAATAKLSRPTMEATANDFSIIAPRIVCLSIFIHGTRMPMDLRILTTQFASLRKFAAFSTPMGSLTQRAFSPSGI
jgi:hypothetical protein